MELVDFFRGVIETSKSPIVICDMDYRIVYINSEADAFFKKQNKNITTGTSVRIYFNEETMSKINMSIEWFKEDINNNKVFSYHIDEGNQDVYIRAIRDDKKNLIGFFNYHEFRDPENGKQYDVD